MNIKSKQEHHDSQNVPSPFHCTAPWLPYSMLYFLSCPIFFVSMTKCREKAHQNSFGGRISTSYAEIIHEHTNYILHFRNIDHIWHESLLQSIPHPFIPKWPFSIISILVWCGRATDWPIQRDWSFLLVFVFEHLFSGTTYLIWFWLLIHALKMSHSIFMVQYLLFECDSILNFATSHIWVLIQVSKN